MKNVPFTKMSGAGNDFIVVDNRGGALKGDLPSLARQWCERKHSIGADGLILLEKSGRSGLGMRIFNPDGSEAEMCGNGVRCLAKFAAARAAKKRKFFIQTIAGVIAVQVAGDTVRAKMVPPADLKLNLSVNLNGSSFRLSSVNTGVPHAVQVLDSVSSCDVTGLGRLIRNHPQFAPRGTNVDFISIEAGQKVRLRTYERGVEDETLACGTGAVAAAIVAASLKDLPPPVHVQTSGGEVLKVYFKKSGRGFTEVWLEGPVKTIFEGRIAR